LFNIWQFEKIPLSKIHQSKAIPILRILKFLMSYFDPISYLARLMFRSSWVDRFDVKPILLFYFISFCTLAGCTVANPTVTLLYSKGPVSSGSFEVAGLPAAGAASNQTNLSLVVNLSSNSQNANSGIQQFTYKFGPKANILCEDPNGYNPTFDELGASITLNLAPPASYPDGDITLCVLGKKKDGSLQAYKEASVFSWVLDTLAPSGVTIAGVTTSTDPFFDGFIDNGAPKVIWTGPPDASSYWVAIYDSGNTNSVCNFEAVSSGIYNYTMASCGPLSNGTYYAQVKACDLVGNCNITSSAFTVDLIPPSMSSVTTSSLTDDADQMIIFSSSDASGSGISYHLCSLNSQSYFNCGNGSYIFTNVPIGSNTFDVKAVDNVGNISSAMRLTVNRIPKVEPAYTNASNWNSYIKNDGTSIYSAMNNACAGSEAGGYSACLHGGEIKKVVVYGKSSCANLSLTENLAAFNWTCVDTSGTAVFYSMGLKQSKGLADLINFAATPAWKPNTVTILDSSTSIGSSNSTAIWWTNPLSNLAAQTNLNTAGTIYTVYTNSFTNGVNLNADSVGLVTAPNVSLTFNDFANSSCNITTGKSVTGTVNPSRKRCLVSSGSQNFLWIEGSFSGNISTPGNLANNMAQYNILLYNVKFSRLKNIRAYYSDFSGIHLIGSSENYLSELALAYHNANSFVANFGGLYLTAGSNENFISNVSLNNNNNGNTAATGALGIDSSTDNIVVGVLSTSNYRHGISLSAASLSNNFSHITVINNGSITASHGFSLQNSQDNVLSQIVSINNNSHGLNVSASGGSKFLQIFSGQNGSTSKAINDTTTLQTVTFYGGNVFADSCAGGAQAGISSACVSQNSSPATFFAAPAISSTTFMGQISTDANLIGVSSAATSLLTVLDYLKFDHFYRAWGIEDAAAFPASVQQGLCSGNCHIWDYSLQSSDNILRGKNGVFYPGMPCPSSVHGDISQLDGSGHTFLLNAIEIPSTSGNNNGLCESNESCAYSANLGAFQGFGDPLTTSTCTFQDGAVSGVKMYTYPTL